MNKHRKIILVSVISIVLIIACVVCLVLLDSWFAGNDIFSGKTSEENSELLQLTLKLDSNPEFTGSVLTAYARAIFRLYKKGETGVKTVFDIPLKYLYPDDPDQVFKSLL